MSKPCLKHLACVSSLNNDQEVGSCFILYFFFELDGYDKIAQVLWLKRSADKLKLTKVVKLLKVYGNLMGFILHCISNDFTQCQPRVKAQLISVGFPIYGISE